MVLNRSRPVMSTWADSVAKVVSSQEGNKVFTSILRGALYSCLALDKIVHRFSGNVVWTAKFELSITVHNGDVEV